MSGFWGGGANTKDYELLMEGDTPVASPKSLVGHALTDFNVETTDRVTAIEVYKARGQIQERTVTLRPARQTGVTFTIGFGSKGEIWTPLLRIAETGGQCAKMLYVNRLCPANSDYAHFYAIPEPALNPPTFPNGLITVDDTSVVTQQSEVQAPEMLKAYTIGGYEVSDVAEPYYAIAVMTPSDCVDCENGSFNNFLVGGGAGGAGDAVVLRKTNDRFSSVEDLTTGIAVGNTITSIYTLGDIILVGFADTTSVATATTGGTAISVDGGANFTLDANLTEPVWGVGYFDGQYIAIGGTASGAGNFHYSDDGITWTAVSSSNLPASHALRALAVDEQAEAIYLVGEGGTALKAQKSGVTYVISTLTPPGSPDLLSAVAVFGEDHIAIGGAPHYYAESWDAGATWSQPSVPGSAAVTGIAGRSKIRTLVGVAGAFSERTIMTNNAYKAKSLVGNPTISGAVTGLVTLPGEYNYFIACTDAGEIVQFRPLFPGA